jgi:hypothetical protein
VPNPFDFDQLVRNAQSRVDTKDLRVVKEPFHKLLPRLKVSFDVVYLDGQSTLSGSEKFGRPEQYLKDMFAKKLFGEKAVFALTLVRRDRVYGKDMVAETKTIVAKAAARNGYSVALTADYNYTGQSGANMHFFMWEVVKVLPPRGATNNERRVPVATTRKGNTSAGGRKGAARTAVVNQKAVPTKRMSWPSMYSAAPSPVLIPDASVQLLEDRVRVGSTERPRMETRQSRTGCT